MGDFNLSRISWSCVDDSKTFYANNVNTPQEINFIDTIPQNVHHVPIVLKIDFYEFCIVKSFNEFQFDYNRCDFEYINKLIAEFDWKRFFVRVQEYLFNEHSKEKGTPYKLPWYTPGLKKLKHLRNKHYKVFSSSKSEEDQERYKFYSREFSFLNKFLYRQYIMNFESNINGNPKLFWQFIKAKKGRSDYPSSMFYGERSNFEMSTHYSSSRLPITDAFYSNISMLNVSEDDVILGIKNLKESCKIDVEGLSAHFLKKCVFLDCWKTAFITPIHKDGSKADVRNYRPISKLCNISKLFENIVSFECGYQVDVIYLDLCKAFDKVDHGILMYKLARIGFHPCLLQWIYSYLCNRYCFVYFDGCKSQAYVASSGVPQGSVLGPLLFVLFINDICSCFNNSKCLIYADDVKMFFNVSDVSSYRLLQEDIDRVACWVEDNRLPLNVLKCNYLPFTRKNSLINASYYINNVALQKVDRKIDLGIYFDPKLEFNSHVDYVLRKSYTTLAFIKRNCSEFSNPYTLKVLYSSFVRSKLEYASIVWNPVYNTHIDRLERLQKKFIKFALRNINFADPLPIYEARCRLIHLEALANRRAKSSVMFLYNLINGKIDCPLLLSKIAFNVPVRQLRCHDYFKIYLHRCNYACNEPLIRSLKEFNVLNSNCEIDSFEYVFTIRGLVNYHSVIPWNEGVG
ncbi:uncharacterized protein LOC142231455 [Haematobia irritans]|uniref:uncharacterized protein LOC142231455 n=1 Tax=Haematobia irritans TaxID=7368 RepID=UPI003F4FC0C9